MIVSQQFDAFGQIEVDEILLGRHKRIHGGVKIIGTTTGILDRHEPQNDLVFT